MQRLEAIFKATEQERARITAEQEALLMKEQLAQDKLEIEVFLDFNLVIQNCIILFLFVEISGKINRRTKTFPRRENKIRTTRKRTIGTIRSRIWTCIRFRIEIIA